MAITIRQTLGSFEVLSIVGRGGMGEVYRARDTKLKQQDDGGPGEAGAGWPERGIGPLQRKTATIML